MVIANRTIEANKMERVKQELRREIMLAAKDGYTHFISGFLNETDLIFADIVIEIKATLPIKLEAAIPYRNLLNTKSKAFHKLLAECDIRGVCCEEYSSCFMKCNRLMVQNSSHVIAVDDATQTRRTLASIRYADVLGKELRIISI